MSAMVIFGGGQVFERGRYSGANVLHSTRTRYVAGAQFRPDAVSNRAKEISVCLEVNCLMSGRAAAAAAAAAVNGCVVCRLEHMAND